MDGNTAGEPGTGGEPARTTGIGERLRELRRRKGLSRQDLASADLSAEAVGQVEDGTHVPSATMLRRLAELVGCSVEYLRTGQDEAAAQERELKLAFGDLALRNGGDGAALRAYSEALAAAPFLTAQQVRRARTGQAFAFEKLGRLETAVQLFTALLDAPETVPGSADWSRLTVALCRCHRNAGQPALGIEIGEQALRTLDELGLPVTDDHLKLGSTVLSCYRRAGDLSSAQQLAKRLIRTAEATGSRVSRGVVYWNAATVTAARGRVQEALDLAELALALLAESDDARHLALLKSMYAYLLLEAGPPAPARAKALLEEAHPVVMETGTAFERANCEALLARAAFQLGETELAIVHADRALDLFRGEAPDEVAAVKVLSAHARYRAGDGPAAEALLAESLTELDRLPTTDTTTRTWREAGDLWKLLGRLPEALDAYDRAFAQLGMPGLAPTREG
ncbi:transcriptional regulator [Kitasatospora sp. MMS16-BH015]|uniref:helix-turn-helix domain-containing protein n=1 Tax=Kitasatospora sp. MMS16-BH015 TaxID=2018025 RepID=UPI000CA24322|nr:helix-turn-helix transcriptional regulator [Kitasatospora sp. MMS16-BH015]AUG78044.1 transcriptional regulator [Kitasatospora sp. MMS16-BH015]